MYKMHIYTIYIPQNTIDFIILNYIDTANCNILYQYLIYKESSFFLQNMEAQVYVKGNKLITEEILIRFMNV